MNKVVKKYTTIWFAIGIIIVLISVVLQFSTVSVTFLNSIFDALSTPGTIISLPLHNLVAHPAWVISVISFINGVVYGVIAYIITKHRNKSLIN